MVIWRINNVFKFKFINRNNQKLSVLLNFFLLFQPFNFSITNFYTFHWCLILRGSLKDQHYCTFFNLSQTKIYPTKILSMIWKPDKISILIILIDLYVLQKFTGSWLFFGFNFSLTTFYIYVHFLLTVFFITYVSDYRSFNKYNKFFGFW